MKKKGYLLCLACIGCVLIAAAQETDTTTQAMDEVVLTANRKETPRLQTPFSAQKISRQELGEYGARTTPEALAQVNGVFVQKTNHGGGSPIVRGLTGNQVLILVDGIRLNNSTFRYGPNQYLNTIDPYSIHAVEVVKGTGSVQYGTDAMGGVIQILTCEPVFAVEKNNWSGKGILRYLSGDMEKTARAETRYSGKQLAFRGGVTYRNFGDLVGGDTTGRQSPSGYKEIAADFKLKYSWQPGWEIILSHQWLRQQHVPVYHKILLENFAVNEMAPQQRMLSYAKLKGTGSNRFFRQIEITASWQQNKEGRNSRKNGSILLRKEQDMISTMGMTADILSAPGKNWTANTGLEIYCDKVNSLRKDEHQQTGAATSQRGLYPDGSLYSNYSLYSLHHFRFGRFTTETGIRINLFSISINDTTLGKVKISPSALVGNAALLYHLNTRQSVYAALSSGFRAPNVDDMGTLGIVDFRYEIPAGGLQPERSIHTELGYKYSSSRFRAAFSMYLLLLNDLITRVKENGQFINGYQVYRKENNEKARLKGIEAQVNWIVTNSISISSGISYTSGQNLSKNEPLRRVPPFNGRLMTSFKRRNIMAAAEFLYASKQVRLAQGDIDDNRIPKGGTPGWQVFNLYGGYRLGKLQLNTGFQNILNEDYRTHGSGINGGGRSAFISITVNL